MAFIVRGSNRLSLEKASSIKGNPVLIPLNSCRQFKFVLRKAYKCLLSLSLNQWCWLFVLFQHYGLYTFGVWQYAERVVTLDHITYVSFTYHKTCTFDMVSISSMYPYRVPFHSSFQINIKRLKWWSRLNEFDKRIEWKLLHYESCENDQMKIWKERSK